jgi:hypothetical protein
MRGAFAEWPQGECVSKLVDVSMTVEHLGDQGHGNKLPNGGSALFSSDFQSSVATYFRDLVLRLLRGSNGVTTVGR